MKTRVFDLLNFKTGEKQNEEQNCSPWRRPCQSRLMPKGGLWPCLKILFNYHFKTIQAVTLCWCSAVQSICVYLSPSLGKQLKYLNKTACLKLEQLNSGDLFWLAINFCVFSN